jgi:carboxymethylenebutenolidase
MTTDLRATTISIVGHGDDAIEAYFAEPLTTTPAGGVIVIHHMPGFDEATKEITRKFAANGYFAICVNLYSREAPGASPDDAAATARANGGVPDQRLVGDLKGAMEFLRSRPNANGKVGVIGYCSGGRQSVLAACSLPLDAAVDCYGAFVVLDTPEGLPMMLHSLVPLLGDLSCPLLGLFGVEDQYPSPEQTEELRTHLTGHSKQFEFHTFDEAGHGFFAVDRPSYRMAAAAEGWSEIWKFYGQYLSN